MEAVTLTANFPRVPVLAIVIDADEDFDRTFQEVCGYFSDLALAVPTGPLTLAPQGKPLTGVAVMPTSPVGNNRMLEDLCLASVADDPAMTCVRAFFRCLESVEISHRSATASKAVMRAFLASRDEPNVSLGVAALKRYWAFDHPVFEPLKKFLREIDEFAEQ